MSLALDTAARGLPLWLALSTLAAPSALAQLNRELPQDLEGIQVDQRLDSRLPLELRFVDENGQTMRLGDYFDQGRPVLLMLVYYECPMLCGLVLNGVVETLEQMEWMPGDQFEIVTASIDPTETPALARRKKQKMIERYGRPAAAAGWHFLTGDKSEIDRLADAVGFRYRYVEESGEYAHPAALFVLTPDGRVSRYLFGIQHDPRTVRLSLVEASAGQIGSIVDQFLLTCFRFNPDTGQYTSLALNMMRMTGLLSLIVIGAVLLIFLRREKQ